MELRASKSSKRGLAVDAKDGVFDFGVGGRVDAAADKLVAGVDVFDFAERGGTKKRFPARRCYRAD